MVSNPSFFPLEGIWTGKGECLQQPSGGITLRDYFAAKALAALILKPVDQRWTWEEAAGASYEAAAAMLKAREL